MYRPEMQICILIRRARVVSDNIHLTVANWPNRRQSIRVDSFMIFLALKLIKWYKIAAEKCDETLVTCCPFHFGRRNSWDTFSFQNDKMPYSRLNAKESKGLAHSHKSLSYFPFVTKQCHPLSIAHYFKYGFPSQRAPKWIAKLFTLFSYFKLIEMINYVVKLTS